MRVRGKRGGSDRTWTDAQLTAAVANGRSWTTVLDQLGLSPSGSSMRFIQGHVERLGLSIDHWPIVRGSFGGGAHRKSYHRDHDEALREAIRARLTTSSLRQTADALGVSYAVLFRFMRGTGISVHSREVIERALSRVPTVVIRLAQGQLRSVDSTNFDLRVLVIDEDAEEVVALPPGLERVYEVDNPTISL